MKTLYSLLDRVLFPALLCFNVFLYTRAMRAHGFDWVGVVSTMIPAVCALFLVLARDSRTARMTGAALAGIALHAIALVVPADFAVPTRPALVLVGTRLIGVYGLAGLAAYFTLGRNLAVVPALKELVARGVYRVVRHPIYACFNHVFLCLCLVWPSPRNLLLTACVVGGSYLRAGAEERVLAGSDGYAAYASEVPARLFHPLLWAPLLFLLILRLGSSR